MTTPYSTTIIRALSHLPCLNPLGTDPYGSCPSRCHPHCHLALRNIFTCHICGHRSIHYYTDNLMWDNLHGEVVLGGGEYLSLYSVWDCDIDDVKMGCMDLSCTANMSKWWSRKVGRGRWAKRRRAGEKDKDKAVKEGGRKEIVLAPNFPFDSDDEEEEGEGDGENREEEEEEEFHDYMSCRLCEEGRARYGRVWVCWACEEHNGWYSMDGEMEPVRSNRWCRKCGRERDAACVGYWGKSGFSGR